MSWKQKDIDKAFDTICNKIAVEGFSLRKCLREKGMPESHTFYKWINEDEDKLLQYARATNDRADNIFEDILHIADDVSKDTQTVNLGEVEVETLNTEAIQRSRLRVDARKWMLGKMHPKKYGDVSKHILEGGDKPIQITWNEEKTYEAD